MVSLKAVVQLTMTLAGMSARSIPGVAATAVNSGEIVVDGRLTRTTEIEEPFLKGVENFKVEDDTGHYIALTFDTSGVTASANLDNVQTYACRRDAPESHRSDQGNDLPAVAHAIPFRLWPSVFRQY